MSQLIVRSRDSRELNLEWKMTGLGTVHPPAISLPPVPFVHHGALPSPSGRTFLMCAAVDSWTISAMRSASCKK